MPATAKVAQGQGVVQGKGQVNAKRAVTLGDKGCGNSELDIEKDLAGIEHYQGPAIVLEDGGVSLPGLESMLSPDPTPDGRSESRKWGVKAHIERGNPPLSEQELQRKAPFDWMRVYREERSRIEDLARKPR